MIFVKDGYTIKVGLVIIVVKGLDVLIYVFWVVCLFIVYDW